MESKNDLCMHSLTKQQDTHRLRERIYGYQREGTVRDFQKVMDTLLYLKWITDKHLRYNTWNSALLCASLDGKGVWGRMDPCICMAESLRSSPKPTTTLLIGYNPIQNAFGVKKKKVKI